MSKSDEDRLSADQKFELLLSVLTDKLSISPSQAAGLTREDLAEVLSANAQSMKKALKPENETHPNISTCHPGGGPIPPLPCEIYYVNFPVHKALETHADRERELLAQVRPGVYRVLRKDLSDMEVTVRADTTPTGVVKKLFIDFPVAREEKHQIPPMHVVLYQIVHADVPAHQRYLAASQEHLTLTLLGASAL